MKAKKKPQKPVKTVQIDAAIHAQVRKYCEVHGLKLHRCVETALINFLSRQKEQ